MLIKFAAKFPIALPITGSVGNARKRKCWPLESLWPASSVLVGLPLSKFAVAIVVGSWLELLSSFSCVPSTMIVIKKCATTKSIYMCAISLMSVGCASCAL